MTRIERIEAGLLLLCKTPPPAGAVEKFENGDDYELHEFAVDHGPIWTQGIAVIDAAILMAETEPEGAA